MLQAILAGITGTHIINRTISSSISLVQSAITYIYYGNNSNESLLKIKRRLHELDIQVKLKLFLTYLSKENKSVREAIICEDSTELIAEIESLLCKINSALKEFESSWFQSYRNINVDNDLNELETCIKVLDDRINLLNVVI